MTNTRVQIRSFTKVLVFICLSSGFVSAEVVSIFYDQASGPISFAANDIKAALVANGHTAEMLNLSELKSNHAKKKVVLSLVNSDAVKTVMVGEGATAPTSLGEQALALRTSSTPQLSYWGLGGDTVGTMYAGFQIAENIKFNGYGAVYNLEEAPTMKERGVKINLPLDARLPTYGGVDKDNGVLVPNGVSAEKSIPNVWDMSFWKTWLDEQARHRYNVLSIWNNHPFPALVKVAGYENASLPIIEGFNGLKFPELTLDKRKAFWKEVMNYAHSRGFQFHFVIWSIQPEYARDQYPELDNDVYTNTSIITYMSKSMTALLNEYPEIDGLGICACDNMSGASSAQAADWTWKSYGQSIFDYAKTHPEKKLTIMHRGLKTSLADLQKYWKPLIDQKIYNFDYEVKYANAHMYGTTSPDWYASDKASALAAKQKTWMTIRNDDYFYLDWGDPNFVREYIDNFPDKSLFYGFNIGADVYQPTRAIFYKDKTLANQLEVQRNWYIQMLWGRIGYNRNIKDDVFINTMAKRFGLGSGANLFNAWAKASSALPKITDLMGDEWKLDLHWYPEACWGRIPMSGSPDIEAFKMIKEMGAYGVASGSKLCPMALSAEEKCPAGKKNSYALADEMEADATEALRLIGTVAPNGSYPELGIKIKNAKQIAYLGNYFATKIRAATYYKAIEYKKVGAQAKSIEAAGNAYCWWKNYANAMDEMYLAVNFRMHYFDKFGKNWHYADQFTLDDYTSVGGKGVPDCNGIAANVNDKPNIPERIVIQNLQSNKLLFTLPQKGNYQLSIFDGQGRAIIKQISFQGLIGQNQFRLGKNLGIGLYIVKIEAKALSLIANKKLIVTDNN